MSEEASAPGKVSRSLLKTSVRGRLEGAVGRQVALRDVLGTVRQGSLTGAVSQALVAAHCHSHQPSPQQAAAIQMPCLPRPASAVIRCDARLGQGGVTEAGALNSCLGERLPDRKGSELVVSVLNRSGGSPRDWGHIPRH